MAGRAALAAHRKPQAEARRPEGGQGGSEARPSWPPASRRSAEIRNNDSRPQEEEGSPAATLSLLLCTLPVPRACSLEKISKAAFVSTMLCFCFKKEGSKLSLLPCPFHISYSLESFPSFRVLGDGKCVSGQSPPPNWVPPKNNRRGKRFLLIIHLAK